MTFNFILENVSLTHLVWPGDVWLVMSKCYSSSGKEFSSEIGHCTSVSIMDVRSSSYICGDISTGIKISFLYHHLVSKMNSRKPETNKQSEIFYNIAPCFKKNRDVSINSMVFLDGPTSCECLLISLLEEQHNWMHTCKSYPYPGEYEAIKFYLQPYVPLVNCTHLTIGTIIPQPNYDK